MADCFLKTIAVVGLTLLAPRYGEHKQSTLEFSRTPDTGCRRRIACDHCNGFIQSMPFGWGAACLISAMASLVAANDMCGGCSDDGRSGGACSDAKEACERNICNPTCLGASFDVKIKLAGCSGWEGCKQLEKEAAEPAVQKALAAHATASLCKDMGLCTEDVTVPWVSNLGYGFGGLDAMPLPVPACSSNSISKEELDARCNGCKGAVKVELDTELCPPATNPDKKEQDQYPFKDECKAFKNSDADCEDALPKHKSFTEKCWFVSKKAKGKKGSLESGAKDWVCSCLGCCNVDPACPVVVAPNEDASKGSTVNAVGPAPENPAVYRGDLHDEMFFL